MENLAFLHASAAYEDPSDAPTFRSLEEMGLTPSPAMVSAAVGAMAGLAVISMPSEAQAVVGYNDRGGAVYDVQSVLSDLGYDVGGVDGVFGPATERAVINYQAYNGLSADGVVGPATASSLGLSGSAYDFGTPGGGGNPGSVTVSTNGSPLAVRTGPGTGYGVIEYLPNGTSVGVAGSVPGWYELYIGGWISADWTAGGGGGGGTGSSGAGAIVISTNGSELVARTGPGFGYGVSGGYYNGAVVEYYDYYAGWYETSAGWVSGDWAYEI